MNPIIEIVRRLGLADHAFDSFNDEAWDDLIDCYLGFNDRLPSRMFCFLQELGYESAQIAKCKSNYERWVTRLPVSK